MKRGLHAFNVVETRIDRGKAREARIALDLLNRQSAVATANGVLGCLNDERQAEAALAHGEEFFRRYATATDAATAASALCKLAGTLCAAIDGPRAGARAKAEAAFKGEGA
jgi:hypothetical protein